MKRLIVLNGQLTLVGEIVSEQDSIIEFKNLLLIATTPQGVGLVPFPLGRKEDSNVKVSKSNIDMYLDEKDIDETLLSEYVKATSGIEIVDNTEKVDDIKSKILDIKNFN